MASKAQEANEATTRMIVGELKKRHEVEIESIGEKIAAITQDLQKERQRSNALEEALAMVGSSQDPASKSSEELLDWSPVMMMAALWRRMN